MAKPINIQLGDRWGIVGATGSGKTVLSRELLRYLAQATRGFVPIYILDSKAPMDRPHKSDFKEFFVRGIGKRHTGNKPPKPISPRGRDMFQVWTPEEDDIEMYDEWLREIYKRREPAVVFIDELSSITNPTGTKYPRYYDILQKQGRGLDIGVISLTQEPSYIPKSLLRQVTHLIRMRINSDYDVTKLAKSMGRLVEAEPDDDHGFYYRNCTVPIKKSPTVYYKDMQEFFGIGG